MNSRMIPKTERSSLSRERGPERKSRSGSTGVSAGSGVSGGSGASESATGDCLIGRLSVRATAPSPLAGRSLRRRDLRRIRLVGAGDPPHTPVPSEGRVRYEPRRGERSRREKSPERSGVEAHARAGASAVIGRRSRPARAASRCARRARRSLASGGAGSRASASSSRVADRVEGVDAGRLHLLLGLRALALGGRGVDLRARPRPSRRGPRRGRPKSRRTRTRPRTPRRGRRGETRARPASSSVMSGVWPGRMPR